MTTEEVIILSLLLGKYIEEDPKRNDETIDAVKLDLLERLQEDGINVGS